MSILQVRFSAYPADISSAKIAFDLIDAQLQIVSTAPKFIELGAVTNIYVEPGSYLVKAKLPNGKAISAQAAVDVNQTKEVVLNLQFALPNSLISRAYYPIKRAAKGLEEAPPKLDKTLFNFEFTLFVLNRHSPPPVRFTFTQTDSPISFQLPMSIELEWEPVHELTNPNLVGQVLIRGLESVSFQFCLGAKSEGSQPKYIMLPPFRAVKVLVIQEDFTEGFNKETSVPNFQLAVSGNNPTAESLLNYLTNGDFQSINKYNEEILDLAEKAIQGKRDDAMGAVIGGYVLLKSLNLSRLYDWVNNLAEWFPEIPDGAIIHGWHLLRQEKPNLAQARDRFLAAANRGIPYYTLGLRYLYDGLNLLKDSSENELEEFKLRMVLYELRPYVAVADLEQIVTTLSNWDDAYNPYEANVFPGKIDLQLLLHNDLIFGGKELNNVNLSGRYLRETNLQGADLQGANLQEANLQEANLQEVPSGTPDSAFDRIALSLSGGGFRASAYSLGTLNTLYLLGLLDNVHMLSTASGGTITGAFYAFWRKQGKPFETIYRDFYTFLEQDTLLPKALRQWKINIDTDKSNYKLIQAFADVYDRDLYNKARFGAFWEPDPDPANPFHLQSIIFGSTELFSGLTFRFQYAAFLPETITDEKGTIRPGFLVGNGNVHIRAERAHELRIADTVAASSCFPGGFEPLVMPDDFFPADGVQPALLNANGQAIERDRIGLVDGGVYDNQGIESLLTANARNRRYCDPKNPNPALATLLPPQRALLDPSTLLLISDVDSAGMDLYDTPKPGPARAGSSSIGQLGRFRTTAQWVLLGVFLLAIFQNSYYGHGSFWAGLLAGLSAVGLLITLGVQWLWNKITGYFKLLGVEIHALALPPFQGLSFKQLGYLFRIRVSSVLTLLSSVFCVGFVGWTTG